MREQKYTHCERMPRYPSNHSRIETFPCSYQWLNIHIRPGLQEIMHEAVQGVKKPTLTILLKTQL